MHDMEKGLRSGGGLVKKKNSSGCLVIKKKGDGTGGVGSSRSRKVFESNKERKRSRLVLSDSGSSEESLEPFRRKVPSGNDKFHNDSVVYRKDIVEDSKPGRNGEIESERKRRLEVFEFDEYDGVDGKRMRKDYLHDRSKLTGRGGSMREFETGFNRHVMIEKKKNSYFDSTSNSSGGRKEVSDYTAKRRFEIEDDEAHVPISSLRQKYRVSSDEPIRLQGKNGVLKVMVNKKKKMDQPHKFYDPQCEAADRKASKSANAIKKNESVGPSFYSDSKCPGKAISFVRTQKNELKLRTPLSKSAKAGDSETEDSDTSLKLEPTSVQARSSSKGVKSEGKAPSTEKITTVRLMEVKIKRRSGTEKQLLPEKAVSVVGTEKSELKLRRPLSKSAKAGDLETEDSDTSLKLGQTSVQARSSSKGVKSEGKAPSAEKITPVRVNEVKIKRGSGTEKQLLREKIRHMLVSAGWTIDYRPRRNRDYLDAVYINPTGTAYWSIVKAYDALQKQLDEEDVEIKPSGDSSPFTPLPDELLSKLTRQTRKKIEKEMKMKRRAHGRSKNAKVAREESAEGTDGEMDDEKLSYFMKQNGKSPKRRSHETTYVSGDDSSGTLYKGSPKQESAGKPSTATNSHVIQGRKGRKIGRCTLLVRSSGKGLNSESDGYVPYMGKRTLLAWLIDSGMVHLSEKVQYMNRRRTRVMLEGWITRDGIHCGCCSKILTVSKFEIHAGSKLRQPFQNIFLESGVSILQCQTHAWNRQEESERCGFCTVDSDGDDPNDDTCGLCGDGGDLICCDGCPSTFHQSCLDIQMLPPGDWHCPNCACKVCGIADGSSAQGNLATVSALLTCNMCEKKYHESCSQEMDALPADLNRGSTSFCGQKCREVFDHLQKLLGVKHELEAGFTWSLIHRTDLDADVSHRGFPQRVECNSKLAVALSVMDECFLPVVDRRSGINLIHNVLYNCGSNFSRLNYSGFYTAILEKGDEIIAAASIRIHGTQLAEMPFIGTRPIYRRQGMCRRLFCAIESALCSLKIEKLIIPAIAEHMHTWTVVFGFNPLEELHKQEMRSMNMLVFPGTDMLQKLLVEQKPTEGNLTAYSGAKSILIKEDHPLTPDLTKKSDADSSAEHDLDICDNADRHNANEMDDKAAAVDSGLQVPAVPSNDNALLNGSSDIPSEPKLGVYSDEETALHSSSVRKSTESSADLKCPPSSDLIPHTIVTMECKLLVASELENNENLESVSVSSPHGTDEHIVQLTSDMNQTNALGMEMKLNGASPVSNADVALDARAAPVEGNVQSSAASDSGDAHETDFKVACVKPVLDSLVDSCGRSPTEEINENLNHVALSTIRGTGESIMRCNSDLNKLSALVESEFPVASEVSPEAKVAPVKNNIQSSAVGDMDDTHQVNGKVSCVEPGIDCFGEISAQNNDINEDPDPATVTDESTMQFNSDLYKQSALEMESNLHVASEVASEEVDTLGGRDILSIAEDYVDKDAPKVNVINASVEPVVNSSGETSADNATAEIRENVAVSTSHGSDGSTIQLESDRNAIEMGAELCIDSVAPSDGERNIRLAPSANCGTDAF